MSYTSCAWWTCSAGIKRSSRRRWSRSGRSLCKQRILSAIIAVGGPVSDEPIKVIQTPASAVLLNRRLTPRIYLGVTPVLEDADGQFRFRFLDERATLFASCVRDGHI